MILKTKTIEVFDIQFDDQMWVLSIIKDEDSQEEYYEIVDSTGEKVVNDYLFDEIIEYFEDGEEDLFNFDEYLDEEDYD